MNKCVDCGAELYPSPSPSHAGKNEHFCKAIQGMVIEGDRPQVVSEPESKKKKSTRSV